MGYRLLLDSDNGEELRPNVTDTHYTFTGLQQDTNYYYRIAAETSVGPGPFSNRTLVRTLTETTSTEPLTEVSTDPDIHTVLGTVATWKTGIQCIRYI